MVAAKVSARDWERVNGGREWDAFVVLQMRFGNYLNLGGRR